MTSGYLTPTVGTVTTPDPGPLPAECVFIFTEQQDTSAGDHAIVSQDLGPDQRAWNLGKTSFSGEQWVWTGFEDGLGNGYNVNGTGGDHPRTGNPETFAVSFEQSDATGYRQWLTYKSDGAGGWAAPEGVTGAPSVLPDVTAPIQIGAHYAIGADGAPWPGRIYSVELRTGLDPNPGQRYLSLQSGTVTTVDTPDMAISGPVRISYRAQINKIGDDGFTTLLMKQDVADGRDVGREYLLYGYAPAGNWMAFSFTDGAGQFDAVFPAEPLGVPHVYGVDLTDTTVTTFVDDVRTTANLNAPGYTIDSAAPVVISAPPALTGRLYWMQMEHLDASGNPTGDIIWRFDANEAPTDDGTTSWTDPRGRVWTVDNPQAISGRTIWKFDADDYPGFGVVYLDPRGRSWTLSTPAAIIPAEGAPRFPGAYTKPLPVGPDPTVEAPHGWTIEIEAEGNRLALDQWTDFSITWNHDGATTSIEVNLVEEMITFMRALVSDLVFKRDLIPLFRFRVMSTEDVVTRDAATVKFTCATYESILGRRIILEDWVLEALDTDAAWTLIQYTQGQAWGELGITREPTPPAGANRQRTLTIGTTIRDAINDFAEADNGFDWWIDVDNVFHMAKPRRGHFHEPHQWQTGAEVAEVVRNNPDDMYASQVLTVGARNETQIPDGSGGQTVYPPPTPQLVTLGTQPFGLWQTAISYSDVVTVASLAEKAEYELRDRANVRPQYKLTLEPGIWSPHFGLGDIVMLRTIFRGGQVRVPIRIEEMEISVTVDGSETISIQARAEEPETYVGPPRPGLPPMPIDPIGTTNGRTSQATRLRPWDDLAAIVKGIDRRVGIQEREHMITGGGGGGGGPGPSGPVAYTFHQGSPYAVWTIVHNLGFFPNVRIITSAGSNAVGDVTYPDSNRMTIAFSAPVSGTAYLS